MTKKSKIKKKYNEFDACFQKRLSITKLAQKQSANNQT